MDTTGKETKLGTKLLGAVCFPVMVGMYYFDWQTIHLGVDILYKMIFAMVLAAIGVLVFLVHTDVDRAGMLMGHFWVLVLPHIIAIVISMPLWLINMTPGTALRRGLFAQIYCIGIIMAVAGILYVFGRGGLWLNLAAMMTANLITIMRQMRWYGVVEYCRELAEMVLTFGGKGGPAVTGAEIHELTFAIGLYQMFLLLHYRELHKQRLFWPALILSSFCYFSGFKRIGVFATVLCILAAIALRALTREKDRKRGWLLVFSLAVIAVAFTYLFLVRAGFFEYLEERFGINSMGRSDLTAFIEEYYHIGPDYLGRGAGFVSRLFSDLNDPWFPKALHNDVLVVYIDLGFWGFWLWMLSFFPLRVWTAAKRQGIRGGISCACCCLYIIVTALTDNTIYYVYVIGAAAILMLSGVLSEEQGAVL